MHLNKLSALKLMICKKLKGVSEYVQLWRHRSSVNQWPDHDGFILDEIVKQLGTSKINLKRAFRSKCNFADLIKVLLDINEIIKTFVFNTILTPVNMLYLF